MMEQKRSVEEAYDQIRELDEKIAELIRERMDLIHEMTQNRIANDIPVFQPEQEKKVKRNLKRLYYETPYAEEEKAIFKRITLMGRKVQAKELIPCNIALIGFMGCGKSTISSYLQKALAMDLAEMDEMIVEQEGMSIPQIFEKYGEEYFRNCESNLVVELQKKDRTIISCGGGLVMRQENVDNLKKHSKIVLLTAKPETIYERVKNSTNRPILNGHMNVEYIAELMEKRRARYEEAADIIVETDNKNVREICEELLRKLR